MIEVNNLKKTWRRRGKTVGLLGASFTVPTGQIVGVLGDNGAGKTTLLRTMAGLLPAAVPELAIKIPVDCALFFVNYLAQKRFVYAKGQAAENK